jgi:uncharacterized membrane protein
MFHMTQFSIDVDIEAPPEKVWAVLLDIERWPEWDPPITSLERLDTGPFTVGSRARIRQPKLRPAEWRVTELDHDQRNFTWITRSPGVQVTGGHRVQENGDGSRVTLSIQMSGLLAPLVSRFTGGLTQQYVTAEAKGLKARSEGLRL